MKNKFEAAIFDMDGLLLDSERLALVAFDEALEEVGLEPDRNLFLKTIGTNAASCKEILRNGLEGKTDADEFGRLWFQIYNKKVSGSPIPLKDGVITLLDHVSKIGLPAAVATSTESSMAKKKLERSGILEYFEIIVGGERVKNGKPDPEIYLVAANDLAVNPKNCLGLEDSENGVKSAVSAGLTVIQIPDLAQPSKELKSLGHIILRKV